MISSLLMTSNNITAQFRPAVIQTPVSFQANPVGKYVKPIEVKHIGLLDKLGEFFAGVSDMLKNQQKSLATQSGALNVKNIADPIPEANIRFDDVKSLTIRPKKFRLEGSKDPVSLCHFEYSSPKTSKFDIVMTDGGVLKKGDIFSYDYHRADKHPIRDNEAKTINNIFERYGEDILNIIRKYQKKLS